MSYLLSMIVLVVREILRRHGIVALVALVVISLAVGTISHLSGGNFLVATEYAASVLAGLGVVAVICTVFAALTKWG